MNMQFLTFPPLFVGLPYTPFKHSKPYHYHFSLGSS